jgi:hypothetical protein
VGCERALWWEEEEACVGGCLDIDVLEKFLGISGIWNCVLRNADNE